MTRLGAAPSTEEGRWVRIETLKLPSMEPANVMMIIDIKDSRYPIVEYILREMHQIIKWKNKKTD